MYVVGVTGGIGSGKTTATDYFASLGIDIVDADIASRVVVEPGRPALQAIAAHFGESILRPDGELDRAALRKRIFTNEKEKAWLEALLHPLIAAEIKQSLEQASSPYSILVSPLLIEGGQAAICDRVLVVDAPETLQISRTVERDNNDPKQVERIIAAQASRQERLQRADDVIENSGSLETLHQQINQLHQQYLHFSSHTMPEKNDSPTVNCPTCQTAVKWSQDNPNRPFCSERCRNQDFVAWANEENRVPGNQMYDDLLSGDLNGDDNSGY